MFLLLLLLPQEFTDVSVNLVPSADTAANGAAANGGSGGAASPAGGASPAAASGPSDEWTEEQQLALVAAMKKYGKVRPQGSGLLANSTRSSHK